MAFAAQMIFRISGANAPKGIARSPPELGDRL
jgi:hypothetical protein